MLFPTYCTGEWFKPNRDDVYDATLGAMVEVRPKALEQETCDLVSRTGMCAHGVWAHGKWHADTFVDVPSGRRKKILFSPKYVSAWAELHAAGDAVELRDVHSAA